MKKIILVRHGENKVDNNIPNNLLELSTKGINQAKEVSKKLNNKFDIVISSPSKRTIQTAKIITDKDIIIDDKLLERGWYHSNGNETDIDATIRFKKLLFDLEDKYKDKIVLLVTHGALIRLAEDVIENKTIPRDRINNCDIIIYERINDKYERIM